jgi:hypothetical protein
MIKKELPEGYIMRRDFVAWLLSLGVLGASASVSEYCSDKRIRSISVGSSKFKAIHYNDALKAYKKQLDVLCRIGLNLGVPPDTTNTFGRCKGEDYYKTIGKRLFKGTIICDGNIEKLQAFGIAKGIIVEQPITKVNASGNDDDAPLGELDGGLERKDGLYKTLSVLVPEKYYDILRCMQEEGQNLEDVAQQVIIATLDKAIGSVHKSLTEVIAQEVRKNISIC